MLKEIMKLLPWQYVRWPGENDCSSSYGFSLVLDIQYLIQLSQKSHAVLEFSFDG